MDKFIIGCIIVVILVIGLKGCADSAVEQREKDIKNAETITQFYDEITKEVGNPNAEKNKKGGN